jgi:hypothetical protein
VGDKANGDMDPQTVQAIKQEQNSVQIQEFVEGITPLRGGEESGIVCFIFHHDCSGNDVPISNLLRSNPGQSKDVCKGKGRNVNLELPGVRMST